MSDPRAEEATTTEPTGWEVLYGVVAADNNMLQERIAELESGQVALAQVLVQYEKEIAKLEAQNDALRTVVAAWAHEHETGDVTLQDALDAVKLIEVCRDVRETTGVALTSDEQRDAMVRTAAELMQNERIEELERREAVYQAFALEADRMLGEAWWETHDESKRAAELFSQIIMWLPTEPEPQP